MRAKPKNDFKIEDYAAAVDASVIKTITNKYPFVEYVKTPQTNEEIFGLSQVFFCFIYSF